MIPSTSDRPTAPQTALVYTLLIIVVLTVFAVTLTMYISWRLEKHAEQELSQQALLLVNTMSSYHSALSDSAVKIAHVFKTHFPGKFTIDPSENVTIQGRKTPLIRNGSVILNLNNSIVDDFTEDTKAVGTVFVRSDKDFVRVSTSLTKQDGSRALGTLLERSHPAYSRLLNGEGYVGKAELFGKDYMTSYQPVMDDKGNVIAVLFVGLDFTDNLKGLKDKIRNTKIGRSGYIYVMDAKEGLDRGKLKIHPVKEGINIIDYRDSDGRQFIREMLEKKNGIISYPWINRELGETEVREKLVAYRTLIEWNWVVCAGSWLDELNEEAIMIRNSMIGATSLVALVLILLFRTMLRMEKRLTDELQTRIDDYQESQEELQVTEEMLRAQVDDFMHSQDVLLETEDLLRQQIRDYQATHDQLLASEEQLKIQLDLTEESSIKFKAVFDNSPISVTLTSIPDGAFYEVNRAFSDMFGYSRDEAVGKSTIELSLWQKEKEYDSFLKMLRENGEVHNFEAVMRRKNGEEISVLCSGTRLEIAGKPLVLSAVMDVTEQKRLQNQLHQLQKMEVVGQLAGGIAHDFNNMLTGILASAEILRRRLADDEKNSKMVGNIIEAATRSADLTHDLLTISRKSPTVLTPVAINESVSSVIGMLEHTIDKRIRIAANLASSNPVVMCDQTQLNNILLNLGVNARDAMPEGGTLTYSTAERMLDEMSCRSMGFSIKPGRYLELAVSDTGVGMTADILEHIFEPFFTTKPSGKGTGLGLASVYGTVKNHHGEVIVQSQPGFGSIFKVYLPLVSAGSCEQAAEGVVVRGSGGILLVDDEEMLRSVGRELLEDLGYKVFLAENGEQALEVYAAHRDGIALVMLDVIMPRMGGREACLRLRELEPGLKVLFCSGFSREGTENELLEMGANGFIHKPYNLSELSRAVAGVLGQG
ncbi:MAG: Cache 3/Cache 2 fusion domain-containing protein [Geobacteraceae bacterium]|nr:Cache 3/Cache 2 fusion domain-containing protein [Geobacteraceae bacterium]